MLSTSSTSATAPKWMGDLSDDIQPILECARKVENNRNELHETYINWLPVTKETITAATKIRDEMVDTNRKNNYVHVGGAAGGIAGSILGIIGAVSAIPTGGASLILVGGVLATTGTLVSVGSSMKRNAVTETLCKQAVDNIEKIKQHSASFEEELKRYYDAVDEFNSLFKTIKGNDIALSLFYEFADVEGFGLLDDLTQDRQSRNKVRSALLEIIESDVTKVVPRMLSQEFLKSAGSQMKSVGEKIRNMLASLRNYIENDPELRRIFCDRLKNILLKELRMTRIPKKLSVVKILTVSMTGSAAVRGYINIKMSLRKMSETVRVCLVTLNVIFVVIGLVDLMNSLVNLEHGSQSDETKSITEVIDELKKNRKDVIDQMEANFGW